MFHSFLGHDDEKSKLQYGETAGTVDPPSTEDVHQENTMLRAHLVELNRHILIISDDSVLRNRIAELESALDSTESLRNKTELLLSAKLEEVKNLNSLVESQAQRAKDSEQNLRSLQRKLINANIDMLEVSTLRATVFTLRTDLDTSVNSYQSCRREIEVLQQELQESKSDLNRLTNENSTFNDDLQRQAMRNMKLESEKRALKVELSTAEQTIKLKSEEIQTISDKLVALTTDRNRLKHTAESLSKCLKSKIISIPINASESSLDDCVVSESNSFSSRIGAPTAVPICSEQSPDDKAKRIQFHQYSKDNDYLSLSLSPGVVEHYGEICTCDAGTVFEALFGSDKKQGRI